MFRATCGVLALLIVGGTACNSNDTSPPAAASTPVSPVVSPSASSPSVSPPADISSCTTANATDLTADDPYVIVIRDFRFKPDCFMADFAAASIAIENRDDVAHTFSIDGTLVNAPLRPHKTYKHGPGAGFLDPGTYPFHCSIHPQITGVMIVI